MDIIRLRKDLLDLMLEYGDECSLGEMVSAFDWAASQISEFAAKSVKEKRFE